MQVNRGLDRLLQRGDQREGVVGGDEAGHVLDADRVRTHGLELLGLLHVVVDVVDLAAQARLGQGVADAALEVLAGGLDGRDDDFEVAVVVQGVEDPEDVHAVGGRPLDEGLGDVVGVVAVADQVLAAQQHRERGLLDVLLQDADALPGILAEEAVHRVEGRPAPDLHGPEADLVHHLGDREHVFGPAAGREQGLVAVAQREVLDLDGVLRLGPLGVVVHLGHLDGNLIGHRSGLLLN